MLKTAIKGLLGSRHKREAKKLQPLVDEINRLAESYQSLSDDELRAKTDEFRARIEAATGAIKAEIEELRRQKRSSTDPDERQRLAE